MLVSSNDRSLRSVTVPVLLAVFTCASFALSPVVATKEAPYQALWISTGIALLTSLTQSIRDKSEEVSPFTLLFDRNLTERTKIEIQSEQQGQIDYFRVSELQLS